jgi:hypothetical protein
MLAAPRKCFSSLISIIATEGEKCEKLLLYKFANIDCTAALMVKAFIETLRKQFFAFYNDSC